MKKPLSGIFSGASALIVQAVLCAVPACGQGFAGVEQTLRSVADRVVHDASYQFEDRHDSSRYVDPEEAPPGARLLPASPSNDWRYWNGVLNIARGRLGELTGEGRHLEDAANQVIRYHRYLFNERRGLMHHCWYSDSLKPGVAFWGRANGWALLAQVELLDRLPGRHRLRDTLLSLFRRHIRGILQYQDDRGLWHQLLDRADSFAETSCSAMFTYAIARGVNRGYLAWGLAQRRPGEGGGVCRGRSGLMGKSRAFVPARGSARTWHTTTTGRHPSMTRMGSGPSSWPGAKCCHWESKGEWFDTQA